MPFNRLNHNILGEIRPWFRLRTNLNIEDVIKSISTEMQKDTTIIGHTSKKYAMVKI